MKGIAAHILQIHKQVRQMLTDPPQVLMRQVFDVGFIQLSLETLIVSDFLISNSNIESKTAQVYSSLVESIKVAKNNRPKEDSDNSSQQSIKKKNQENKTNYSQFFKQENNQRGYLGWFTQKMTEKQNDTANFVQSVSHFQFKNSKTKKQSEKKTIVYDTNAVQTDIAWVKQLQIVSPTLLSKDLIGQITQSTFFKANFEKRKSEIINLSNVDEQKDEKKIKKKKLLPKQKTDKSNSLDNKIKKKRLPNKLDQSKFKKKECNEENKIHSNSLNEQDKKTMFQRMKAESRSIKMNLQNYEQQIQPRKSVGIHDYVSRSSKKLSSKIAFQNSKLTQQQRPSAMGWQYRTIIGLPKSILNIKNSDHDKQKKYNKKVSFTVFNEDSFNENCNKKQNFSSKTKKITNVTLTDVKNRQNTTQTNLSSDYVNSNQSTKINLKGLDSHKTNELPDINQKGQLSENSKIDKIQENMNELIDKDPQEAKNQLQKYDQIFFHNFKDMSHQRKITIHKIQLFQLLKRLHRKLCGQNCSHLKRFYKFINNSRQRYQYHRKPLALATNKLGFF